MVGNYIQWFDQLGLDQVASVGGKNASLGEIFRNLVQYGIKVPDGFVTTTEAYWDFISSNNLQPAISELLHDLDTENFSNLSDIGKTVRALMMDAKLSETLEAGLTKGFVALEQKYGQDISLAVRSSATAEDLPDASFAGQQESYLNVRDPKMLLKACQSCFASLFTDRAIKYREDMGFDHMKVALSIGIQLMVRAGDGCSGVIFTLDPDSGFDQVMHISGVWGFGENIVQGTVSPDEYYVFKQSLASGKQPIIQRRLGAKTMTMTYASPPTSGTINTPTPIKKQKTFVLTDQEVIKLAKWSSIIEEHYGCAMDIEWAKDGETNEIYILQARPETVHSNKPIQPTITTYKLLDKGTPICRGSALGNKIASGKACILFDPHDADKLAPGDILITSLTNPDWNAILRKAGAIVTDKGGRTSHAAIVAREMGAVAIIGTGNATDLIVEGQDITVSCAEGNEGVVYQGLLDWEEQVINIGKLKNPVTKPMLILADPQQAFKLSSYPVQGIGLMRMEFVINNSIRVHPLALKQFQKLSDSETRSIINELCRNYKDKVDYFVHNLAEGIATIAAAFYPREVIVRTSDFKSNEYANLIGGHLFEPSESNPMLGFRGAARYIHPIYKEGFEMECKALNMVREAMGLTNVKVMIPFCRTLKEAEKVLELMRQMGLERGKNDLQVYMMVEIPSNVLLAREFADLFDGFSIGSNDLTQLTLGVDRDSELLSETFDVNDPAVRKMLKWVIKSAKETRTTIGLCGQAPSDYPEFAQFLVDQGIDSISFNADALFKGIENINQAEAQQERLKDPTRN